MRRIETERGIGEGLGLEIETEMATDEGEEVDLHEMTGTEDGTTDDPPGVTPEAATGTDPDPTIEEVTGMIEIEVTTAGGTNLTGMRTAAVDAGIEMTEEMVDATAIEGEGQADLTLEATGEAAIGPDLGRDLETGTTRETTETTHPMIDLYQPIEGLDPTRDAPGLTKDGLKALVESKMTMTRSPTTNHFQEGALHVVEMVKTSPKSLMRMGRMRSQKLKLKMKLSVKMQKSFSRIEQL